MINKWLYFGGTADINCNELMACFNDTDEIIVKDQNVINARNNNIIKEGNKNHGTTLTHKYNLLVIVGLLIKSNEQNSIKYTITSYGKEFLKYSSNKYEKKLTDNQLKIILYGCRNVRIDKKLYKRAKEYIEPFSQCERIIELVYNNEFTKKEIRQEFFTFPYMFSSFEKSKFIKDFEQESNKKDCYILNFLYNIGLIYDCENLKINSCIKEDLKKMSLDKNNGTPMQIIICGVPGTGKSHYIKNKILKNVSEEFFERVIFYESYDYSDFVGSIQPREKNDKLIMEYIPGPFARLLKKSIEDKTNQYYLIIEEINRGNAPGIFGDIFQLLDRNNDTTSDQFGISDYKITNDLLAKYIYNDVNIKIYLPQNFHIIATMNSSDQNIYPLDNAFKRRFEINYLPIVKNETLTKKFIAKGIEIELKDLIFKINEYILERLEMPEDKQIGSYFIKNNNSFYELLYYIFDDIEKNNFSDHTILNNKIKSKQQIINFLNQEEYDLIQIFSEEFIDTW